MMSKPGSPTLGSLRANRPEGKHQDQPITSDDISDAAEALREVEIQAAREDAEAESTEAANTDTVEWHGSSPVEEEYMIPVNLEELSIDELRAVAGMLRISDYAQITDQEELIALIRTYAKPTSKPK
jgi:hypothetical protein